MSESPGIIDPATGRPFARLRPAYDGGNLWSGDLFSWRPQMRSPDSALLGDRNTIIARTADVARNNGIVSGALQSQKDCVVGTGFKLVPTPDYRALGQTMEWAQQWKRDASAVWRKVTEDPDYYGDARRRLSFNQQIVQAYYSYMTRGEMTATIEWMPRRADRYATCLNVIHPDLLSQPDGQPETWTFRAGVQTDQIGAPQRYWFRQAHPSDYWSGSPSFKWKPVDAYTPWGRKQVVHVFDEQEPGQTRGKPGFVSVLASIWKQSRYEKAALEAAIINAMYAAVIESNLDHAAVAQAMGADDNPLEAYTRQQADFYRNKSIQYDGAKIPHLLAGENLKLLTPQHPTAAFEQFESSMMRHFAAGSNMSYEQVSRDYSKTNYSSARAAMLEAWRFFAGRRVFIVEPFVTPFYAAVIEEAIDRGDLTIPAGAADFYAEKAAYTRFKLIGAPRGHIDPLKENQAKSIAYHELQDTTYEDLCAERGHDFEEVIEQRKFEQQLLKDAGLAAPNLRPIVPAPDTVPVKGAVNG